MTTLFGVKRKTMREVFTMADSGRFDPFNDRLCRNVRNALSESLPDVLEQNELAPARRIADHFLAGAPPAPVVYYINRRMDAYRAALADVQHRAPPAPLGVALVLWDRRLFFETHDYLERFWMPALGDQRALLQALIRAAGAYVHLEQGNLEAARRIADKAIPVLEKQRHRLAGYTDPGRLIETLKHLDPDPPMLSTLR
jgi:uncharacterized protein